MLRPFLVLAALAMLLEPLSAQSPYRKPPAEVSAILDAKPTPTVSISPTRDTLALIETSRYPSIAEVSEPMLRLAGLRINPKTNGRARTSGITGLTFLNLATQAKTEVKLPEGKVSGPIWSYDGKRFAVSITKADGIALGLGTVADGKLTEVPEIRLNAAIGEAIQWLSTEELLLKTIPAKRGKPPEAPAAPIGPIIQESSGKAAPVRTFQDMLQNAHDEALFEYHGTTQMAVFNVDGKLTPLGEPALITGVDPSPDFKHLLITKLRKPFSYLYPYSAFPQTLEILDREAKSVYTVVKRPLQDKIPIEGVMTGPRNPRWIPTETSTLVWAEALDEGDPKKKVPHRDELFTLAAPFSGKPKSAYKTEHRLSSLDFFAAGTWLVADYDRERKWSRSQIVDVAKPDTKPVVLSDRSTQDRYGDIGSPLLQMLPNGERVIRVLDSKLVLSSAGATAKGEFPTLKTYQPVTKESKMLFQCREGYYETASLLDDEGKKLLIRRESPTEPANYFLKEGDNETALTKNVDPFPELRKVKRELITTKRADGVTISFKLYTPANVKEGEKLPTVFWAYPTEFSSADTASQVSGSQNRFVTPASYSHLFFLTQGYAVMDDVSMPIVGKPESANDNFLEQLGMNAKAAIDKACEAGPVDRDRIGVGGHSYGAFMTANLLAHTDLFKAGIARSGAYNRTLTPFGFQNERRTFWEAPEVYSKMSPFNSAQKIQSPILMIHGQADSNPGTFPVQSERMYQAVRGNGGKAKLVLLPHEDHGYSAKESIEHVLAEQIEWFDTYVKGAKVKGSGEK